MLHSKNQKLEAFGKLLDIMDELRARCPWDRKQTMESLRTLTIEELYELSDAIIKKDVHGIKEELGDLLLHLVFYSKIAEEKGTFDIKMVLEHICDKLIHRHPHIYGNVVAETEEEVKKNWESLKLKEGKKSILEGVPTGLPALVKALRLQEKTAQVGFEWKSIDGVWEKIQEELAEFHKVHAERDPQKMEAEFGDILFSMINYGRYLNINPETALEKTNLKFKYRFEYIEQNSKKPITDMTLLEMEALWQEAKRFT